MGPLAKMAAAQQCESAPQADIQKAQPQSGRGRHRSRGSQSVRCAQQGMAAATTDMKGNTPSQYHSSPRASSGQFNTAQSGAACGPGRLLGSVPVEQQAESAAGDGVYRQPESSVTHGRARGRRAGSKFIQRGGVLQTGSARQAVLAGANCALVERAPSALTAGVQAELGAASPVLAEHTARPARGGPRGVAKK